MTNATHLTRAYIHLDRLAHNMRLLQSLAGSRPLWPAIKANAYGHGSEIIARHLIKLGYSTLCLAHVTEATDLIKAGVRARFLVLSATLPEHSETIVLNGCEPAVCTYEMVEALARDARRLGVRLPIHIIVDTGMGRIGIPPAEVAGFIQRCRKFPSLRIRGLMSHFPCADKRDKTFSRVQIECFQRVVEQIQSDAIEVRHMANSAAIFDLPEAHFDAARPGIAIYGLSPSDEIINPYVKQLKPVFEWKTQITFLKEVPSGTGLSYGHCYHTTQPSLIATIPIGYGDGLRRNLSNTLEVLIGGVRCPQVGQITMDQSLIDVTALRGRVRQGDEVVIIGVQNNEEIKADELAAKLGTINYEVVTGVATRIPRVVIGEHEVLPKLENNFRLAEKFT